MLAQKELKRLQDFTTAKPLLTKGYEVYEGDEPTRHTTRATSTEVLQQNNCTKVATVAGQECDHQGGDTAPKITAHYIQNLDLEQMYLLKSQNDVNPSHQGKQRKSTVYSNTVPECKARGKSEPKASHPLAYKHYKTTSKDIAITIDWLTFFNACVRNFEDHHIDFLIDQFITGRYFLPDTADDSNLWDFKTTDCYEEVQPNTGKRFDTMYRNSYGARLLVRHDPDALDKITAVRLDIPGGLLKAMLPANNLLPAVAMIETATTVADGLKLTRCDLRQSTPYSWLNICTVASAALAEQFTGAKKFKVYASGQKGNPNKTGVTVVIGADGSDGSRRSRKIVTFYDEKPVHGRDGIAIEVRNYAERAKLIKDDLIAIYNRPGVSNEEKNAAMLVWVRDYMFSPRNINFCDRDSINEEKYAKNYKRLPWYQAFLDKIGACHYVPKLERPKGTLKTFFKWSYDAGIVPFEVVDYNFGRVAAHWLLDIFLDIKKQERKGRPSLSVLEKTTLLIEQGIKDLADAFPSELREKFKRHPLAAANNLIYNVTQGTLIDYRELMKYPEDFKDVLIF